jgi:ribosome-associated heat shock protein Hsp15
MGPPNDKSGAAASSDQRLDRWLWFSRLIKSRTLAAQLVLDGKVRVNRTRIGKPSYAIRTGDILTIALKGEVQIVRVLAPGHRRGPPLEALGLYENLSAPSRGAPP